MTDSWAIKILVVDHGFEGLCNAGRSVFYPARSVFGGGRSGVAHHSAGGDVACEPGEGCGCVLWAKRIGPIDLRDVVDGVRRGVDEFRRGAKQECGFDLAGVKAVGLLLRTD